MSKALLRSIMEMSRRKTLETLAAIEKHPQAQAVLAWRPGPGRAHLAWQLMHIAATDDRHLYVRMRGGEPHEPDLVQRFAGGSVPDDKVPTLEKIRSHLESERTEMLKQLDSLSESDLTKKPNDKAPWTYLEWFQVLAWHEAHHQGQAHLTLNLYRAAHDPASAKVGH
jgi:uncharacterized damage-inducible protein DinB